MTAGHAALLCAAAFAAGALNAVAGGGSFFTFPALVFSGVPPIEANATSSGALWPASRASAVGYRRELPAVREQLVWLGVPSIAGGIGGALLLVRTPQRTFTLLLPFLLLLATLVFTFGESLRKRLQRDRPVPLAAGAVIQAVISIYGGYFGGGMGMMMLATFALLGMTDIHRMNGLKSLLAVFLNGAALVTFMLANRVVWLDAGVMAVASIAGGYGGAALARRVDARWVRWFVIAIGFALTAWFFYAAMT
jgi:uncharacterized membrane protein YfcA